MKNLVTIKNFRILIKLKNFIFLFYGLVRVV